MGNQLKLNVDGQLWHLLETHDSIITHTRQYRFGHKDQRIDFKLPVDSGPFSVIRKRMIEIIRNELANGKG